ncbi:MAG: carboxypeptidase-like regulatory domain-containing protein, partial [Armatimonadota bacterium]
GNFSGTMIRWKTTGYPTSPTDGTLLANKTNNPSTTDTYDHTGLTNGTNYYYTAFSHDDLNHYAAGIVAQGKPTNLRIGEIKGLANGMIVDLLGKTVSGKFASDGVFYIQESDRSSAIRILGTTTAIVGQKVDVTSGQLDTRVLSSQNSERQIKLATITPQSSGTIIPVTMNSRALGGQSFGPNVPGVKDGVGLNNMGLLVRLTGKVVDKLATYLWMDDGGGIIDSAGIAGVLVKCPSTTIPVLIGDIVSVVGIIEGSVPSGDTQNRRQIRLRDYNDLIALASTGPGTISGSVTDGVNGIIGATVTANPGGYSATTGTGGSYSLTSIPSGLFSISASKSGYTDASSSVTVNAGQTSTANFTLTRTPGAITGTVRDASLQGIQGAAITLSPGGYQTTSEAGGIYRILNVPVGIYSATATKSGYTPQTIANQTVPSGGVATVNFTLGVATSQEKLVNGNFEGGFNSFGYGLIALDWTDVARDANSQYATDWGSFNAWSPHNNVQSVYTVSPPNGEAGISQTVIGLAPGAGYTFTAEAYQTSSSTTCWMAVDENGGSTLPSRTISFSNNSNTWNTQTVSGNVGSSGSLTVFLWGWNSATPGGAVYFDNANLVVNP